MNYSKMLDDPECLKNNLKQILKDLNKRLSKAEEENSANSESETTIQELQEQIAELEAQLQQGGGGGNTSPNYIKFDGYIDITTTTVNDIPYMSLNTLLGGSGDDYLFGTAISLSIDASNLDSSLLSDSDYRKIFTKQIVGSNLKINDIPITITETTVGQYNNNSNTITPQLAANIPKRSETVNGVSRYVTDVPLYETGNTFVFDLTNALTGAKVTLQGTFDSGGYNMTNVQSSLTIQE